MLIKAGVDISRLERNTRRSLNIVSKVLATHGHELIITSTYEGNHSPGSLHYANQAYDFRSIDIIDEEAFDEIVDLLGHDYDVVWELDHIHVEYDPKG